MDQRQFEKEYRSLYLPLGMFALRLLGDTGEAEDTVQETFATAWQRVSDRCDIGDFKAYMYRAVRNNALMKMRSRTPLADIDSIPLDITDEQIDTSERDARLWRAIDRLPERCRQAFLMSKRDGMSYAEIAAETGTSVKTVENQISKAFRLLRAELKPSSPLSHPLLPFL